MSKQEQQLNRLTIFEALVFGIYGNWLISLLDKVSFDKSVWIFGLWFQPFWILMSFFTIILLFFCSIYRPKFVTGNFGILLGFGHAASNYLVLWAEGIFIKLFFFYWIGTVLFFVLYPIELRRASIGQRQG